jgi:hypothetical protein
MRRKWIFFAAPPALLILIAICGEVVMHLWNWLLPALFGWRQVTFWQALGLLLLCRILFGGFGGHRPDRTGPRQRLREHWERRRLGERWEEMTPEEREKFRQNLRTRCGDPRRPASETKEPA